MNAIGIDVSEGKSMVAAMRPAGEVIIPPFEVEHIASELRALDNVNKLGLEVQGMFMKKNSNS